MNFRIAVVAVAAIMMAGGFQVVRGADEAAPAVAATTAKMQTTCPVMEGQPVNKKLFVDFEGKRVYVCCGACIKKVKKNPAKYIKMIEDQGVTLDKAEAQVPGK